jgi:tetratricopeptide (TPR) repeat protein
VGLAKALRRLATVDAVACRLVPALAELERARTVARRARDAREEARVTNAIFHCLVVGPTPVAAAIRRCEELIEETGRHRSVEAFGLAALANLHGMLARFDEAERFLVRSDAIFEELGQTRRRIETAFRAGEAAMLAGDPTAAHIRLARAYRRVLLTNQRGYLASLAAAWAEPLVALGRWEQAERLTAVSRALAGVDDVNSQVRWRQIRARIVALRGDLDGAAALAREAVARARATDALNMRAGTLLDLAEICNLGGDADAARSAALEGAELYVQKGNLVGERKAAALAIELAPHTATAEKPSEVRVSATS